MECENSYHCLAGKNIAFHIHLHTPFHAIYAACSAEPKHSPIELERVSGGGKLESAEPPSPALSLSQQASCCCCCCVSTVTHRQLFAKLSEEPRRGGCDGAGGESAVSELGSCRPL